MKEGIKMTKINNRIRKFWGVSDIGFSFMSAVDTAFFVIFLTDIARLPLSIIAVLISVTGILDIITSLISGVIVDKVNFKHGKYRPWLIYCPPIVVISFTLMFSKIGTDISAAIICGLGYVISHAIWNIAWAANRTLVTVLTDDGEERAFLSSRVPQCSPPAAASLTCAAPPTALRNHDALLHFGTGS